MKAARELEEWSRKKDNKEKELTTTILDFIELPCSHSAMNMANAVKKSLQEYGIEQKVSEIQNTKN